MTFLSVGIANFVPRPSRDALEHEVVDIQRRHTRSFRPISELKAADVAWTRAKYTTRVKVTFTRDDVANSDPRPSWELAEPPVSVGLARAEKL